MTGDLTVTAMYTSHAWKWGGFEAAELFATRQSRDVFNATNLALGGARLVRRELPSLRHSLVQRHAMLDRLIAERGCPQVLELAAGLSRRGAAMSANPGVRYVEVDLPGVIEHKRELLARSERGREVLARDNLALVTADVREVELGALVEPQRPVFVVAEGLFMYLEADAQRALWRRIASVVSASPGSAFAFDLVPACEQPPPGAVGRALGRAFSRFTRGAKFAFDQRTRDDIAAELAACGLPGATAIEPGTAPARWELPFLDRRTQALIFVCSVS